MADFFVSLLMVSLLAFLVCIVFGAAERISYYRALAKDNRRESDAASAAPYFMQDMKSLGRNEQHASGVGSQHGQLTLGTHACVSVERRAPAADLAYRRWFHGSNHGAR